MRTLSRYFWNYAIFGSGAYLLLFLAGNLITLPPTRPFTGSIMQGSVILFSACWVAAMVSIYVFLARRVRTNPREVFLHMGVIAMLGPVCEVLINTFCRYVFGSSLWEYHFFPVHNGDTSVYSYCVWAMYGCHLYFMDRRFIHATAAYRMVLFALILSIDAIILEFILNLTSIYTLHTYIFYYLPGDVQHLTTIGVAPFYFCGGILASAIIIRGLKRPIATGLVGFMVGFLFVFWPIFF